MALDVLLINLHSVRNKWVLHPPLGLCYLASVLEREGYSVEILDANTGPQYPGKKLVKEIERRRPQIAGMTLFTPDLGTFGEILPDIRDLIRRGVIGEFVVGGHHPSYQPEIVKQIGLNYGVMWDGEETFLALCNYLLRGIGDISKVPGIISNVKGNEFINRHRLLMDMNNLPHPARHLIDNNAYFNPMSSEVITSLIVARGCPFTCSFCSGATETSKLKMRYRALDHVKQELDQIKALGINYIEFVDETFTLNKRLIFQLCDVLEDYDFKWGCQTRADVVQKDLIFRMAEVGCDKISFGIDASTDRIRKSVVGKVIPNEKFRNAFKWTNAAGIKSVANIIFGFPGEREYEIQQAFHLVRSLRPTFANFQPLYIYPATEIYNRALDEGKISREYWGQMVEGAIDMVPVYEQSEFGLDSARMRSFGRHFIWKFYLNPMQIGRLLKHNARPKDIANYARIAGGMYNYYFRAGQA